MLQNRCWIAFVEAKSIRSVGFACLIGLLSMGSNAVEVGFDDFERTKEVVKGEASYGVHPQQSSSVSANWYNDGDYSRDSDGNCESIEQFVIAFSKAVKPDNAEFAIVVPDNENADPYGEGRLGEIVGRWDNNTPEGIEPLVPNGELGTLFLGTNACNHDDDFTLGLYTSYTLEMTVDWTRLLNTSETGYRYWDERFNPVRLVIRGMTDQFDQPLGDIVGTEDIALVEDASSPKVVYRELMVQGFGQYADYEAGVMRFAFDEPMQILDVDGETSNSAGGFTPVEGKERVSVFQVQYVQTEDAYGSPVSGATVDGGYFGWNCIWIDTLTDETTVDEDSPHEYDVDIFDQYHKIKQSREFGWHWVYPKERLAPGKWNLSLSGAGDDAGNVMETFEIEIEVKGQFMTVEEITVDFVTVSFSEPHEGGSQVVLVYSPEYDSSASATNGRYVVSESVETGETTHDFYFSEPFDVLPEGVWQVNGIEFQVGESTSVLDWQVIR